ncbi:Alpha/Beta hydrolase protein [Mrakia frigida]|uniref:alpha/beta hydrolase family protein n=1 Tax=Mrakia frigida TaxID=29902 RepID=UPI003FCBF760
MSTSSAKAPYGSWKSPITTDLITGATISFAETRVSNKFVYHSETRPSEGGRSVIVRTALEGGGDGKGKDVFGADWNARSRVHEYGGGAFVVVPDTDDVLFSNLKDGRIWRVARDGTEPVAVTPESTTHRFAAFQPHPLFSTTHPYLLSILEQHQEPSLPSTVQNSLVLINASTGSITSLRSTTDFYSSCFWDPTSKSNKICWIEWDHPSMPWESSRLCVGKVDGLEEAGGRDAKVTGVRTVAGGKDAIGSGETTVGQPTWVGGDLFFLWDKTGYSLLYRWKAGGGGEPELMMDELKYDLSDPDWTFSLSRYTALTPTLLVLTPLIKSLTTLHLLHLPSKKLVPLSYSTQTSTPFVTVDGLRRISDTSFLFVGTTDSSPPALSILDVASGEVTAVKKSSEVDEKEVSKGMFSSAQGLEFDVPTGEGGKMVNLNVLHFAPKNENYSGGVDGELPPAIIRCHGGPTSRSAPGMSWTTAYWTSRGYAVLDVNYGGSSGFGKEYRERLAGQWGIVDVQDSIETVKHCVTKGLIDGKRVAISGGSAGGFTVLGALTKSDVFAAGLCSYGIGDLELLAGDTHKFESQYLFKLVGGTLAEVPQNYYDRSPVHFAEKITADLLILQGLDDKVVPPGQAQTMVKKIEDAGGKVEAVYYEGEGHGFRKSENIKDSIETSRRALERTFGIEVAA